MYAMIINSDIMHGSHLLRDLRRSSSMPPSFMDDFHMPKRTPYPAVRATENNFHRNSKGGREMRHARVHAPIFGGTFLKQPTELRQCWILDTFKVDSRISEGISPKMN